MATRPYNPAAYVPGGRPSPVATAIQRAGYARPGSSPVRVPSAPPVIGTPPLPDSSASAGGGGGGGAYGGVPFDYTTDPGYLAALAAEQAGSAELDAQLRAARERAFVQFGDPSLAGAFGIGDVSPLTAAMAQQATTSGISTLAGLQRTRDQNQQTIQNTLAAHGIITSGDLGYRTGVNQQNYSSALYGAQQSVLDSLAQAARENAIQKQNLPGGVVTALENAFQNYISNPQYWGGGGGGGGSSSQATTSPAAPAAPPAPPVPKVPTSRLSTIPWSVRY
jgi:hypothetical protein